MPVNHDTLPVETFEQFMLAGDSTEFPMSFVLEFRLDGMLDLTQLKQAAGRCLTLHPLLSCHLDLNRKTWRFVQETIPVTKMAAPVYDDALHFDLHKECGLRILVSDCVPGIHSVGFVFHHACVDGLGALQFVKDTILAYESDLDAANTMNPTPARAMKFLRKYRNSSGGNRLRHLLRWPLDALGMIWALEMVLNRPAPIQPSNNPELAKDPPNASPVSSVACLERLMSPEQTQTTKRRSKAAGQTLNDCAIESFFLAIESWNKRFNREFCGALTRLMIPMNLRKGQIESAANMVAMVNFDRKTGRWKHPGRFRQILKLEMQAVKRFRAGITANRYLRLQKLFHGRWPMQEDPKRCLASCLVSNLGELSRAFGLAADQPIKFGSHSVDHFQVIAPLRRNTNVFVCLFTYLGKLSLNMTYNANVLTREQGEFLLEAVERNLLGETE